MNPLASPNVRPRSCPELHKRHFSVDSKSPRIAGEPQKKKRQTKEKKKKFPITLPWSYSPSPTNIFLYESLKIT